MSRRVKSLDHGLEALAILASLRAPTSGAEIAREMELDPSTVHRLLATLRDRGFVQQDPGSRRYTLGLRLVELGGVVLSTLGLGSSARASLKDLVERTGCAAHLAVLVDGEALYVDKEEGPSVPSITTGIGGKVPGHCTAVGKVLLAGLPRRQLREQLEHMSLQRYTPNTLVSTSEIVEHLDMVRKQGYAIDDEEFALGVRCIGAPVRNYASETVSAIAIADLAAKIPVSEFPRLGRDVREVAEELSRKQGYFSVRPTR
jgi:DNA-binding IclR family transcriptional regulator